MPKIAVPLNDKQIKNAKPKEKEYKLADGYGLYLLISPTGGKLWRFQYRFDGKHKQIAMGSYPDITLADARNRRAEARKQLAHGVDPGQVKKAIKAAVGADADTFEVIGREWFEKFSGPWADNHSSKIKARLENDIYPWLGNRPVKEITPPELLQCLRRIETRGAIDTAHRVKQDCGRIFRYAIATGRAERDPSADLKGAIPPPVAGHFAAVTNPDEVKELLRMIDGYQGRSFVVLSAMKLGPLTFVRPGELRKAEWSEIDFKAERWEIPAQRMKMKKPHIVPLPKQAIAILKEIYPLTGRGKYVFPSARGNDRPMSDNAILAAFRRMGIDNETMTGHGFRAMARTMIRERLKIEAEFIEIQLAHKTKAPNGEAYDRVSFIDERTVMMQKWADYLDELRGN